METGKPAILSMLGRIWYVISQTRRTRLDSLKTGCESLFRQDSRNRLGMSGTKLFLLGCQDQTARSNQSPDITVHDKPSRSTALPIRPQALPGGGVRRRRQAPCPASSRRHRCLLLLLLQKARLAIEMASCQPLVLHSWQWPPCSPQVEPSPCRRVRSLTFCRASRVQR